MQIKRVTMSDTTPARVHCPECDAVWVYPDPATAHNTPDMCDECGALFVPVLAEQLPTPDTAAVIVRAAVQFTLAANQEQLTQAVVALSFAVPGLSYANAWTMLNTTTTTALTALTDAQSPTATDRPTDRPAA